MLDRQADEIWKGMDEETRSAYGEEAFRKAYEALKDHGVSSPNFFRQKPSALACELGGGNPGKWYRGVVRVRIRQFI